ncbi:MAG TPA: STAS domain-containing protein [Roseiflexaceae bacterium]|nr:STAS domain-containing protein [Roseiflexaceae bacterium]
MPARPLAARVRYQPGGAVIDLQGEINAFGSTALSDAYAEAERHNPDVVLLNFAGVDYINSTGIALIVGLLAKARAARRRLVVCGLSEHYVEIFQITRLSDFMTMFPDEESALAGATLEG